MLDFIIIIINNLYIQKEYFLNLCINIKFNIKKS